MTHAELYDLAIGREDFQTEEDLQAIQEALQVSQQERDEWLRHPISQSLIRGLLEKSEEYADRSREQSSPLGDQKLCCYFASLSLTLKKVVTYARTGKYSE